jgi:prepilin-type N-terminal cleavage/methylation domain-containing protein/prepilin-type processing-associated H-X9-DG protein
MKSRHIAPQAFTIIELLVVIAVIAVLVAIQIPALAASKAGVQRIYCSNNLKQVGIAFRTWADKKNNRMPMAVPASQGGAAEAVGIIAPSGNTFLQNLGSPAPIKGVFGMFCVMSNELNSPKILLCPSESAQSSGAAAAIDTALATIFGPTSGTNKGFTCDLNTSYFVGVDANDTRPDMPLSGDHNLATGANQATKVTSFTSAGTNAAWGATAIGWQDNTHSKQGNVTFADGSVQNLNTSQFRSALNKTGDFGRSPGVFTLATGSVGSGLNRLQFP